jgi:hypothetical protein
MATMSSEGAVTVVKECLPPGSALFSSVFLKHSSNGEGAGTEEVPSSTEKDLINRLWNTSDDPDTIRQYVISDELTESHAASGKNVDSSMNHKSVWWRARLVTRALFWPVKKESVRLERSTGRVWREQQSAADADGDDKNTNEGPVGDNGTMDEDVDETEDLLADLSDAISRFKPVILAALARDADAYDSMASGRVDDDALLLAGEVSILGEMGDIVPTWDISGGCALLECLMKNSIVSGMAVAKWALDDVCGDVDEESFASIQTHWWKYVSLALRTVIHDSCSKLESTKMDLGGGIGMIVDESAQNEEDPAQAAALRLDEALKVVVPILRYVVERVCRVVILASSATGTSSDKKIPPAGADVVEGMKRLLRALLFHFNSLVLSAEGDRTLLTVANVQKGFSSMDADGEKLALLCQEAIGSCNAEQGKRLLQSLSFSLEKML